MKIMVTGQEGLLGSELVKTYGSDYEIIGYDIKDGDDLMDFPKLLEKMKGCEQVVHLAAIPRPLKDKGFVEYFEANDLATLNVIRAAVASGCKRIIYASSTSYYGVEAGIPFQIPIKEDQPLVSQYITSDQLLCGDEYLAYHASKVIAEQLLAWYGLTKKIQTIALRFGPVNVKYMGTSVSIENAIQAIRLSLESKKEFWYEAFTIVDELKHMDISKAKNVLGYDPAEPDYSKYLMVSELNEKAV